MWALAVLAMIVHGVGAQTAGICDPVVPDNCLLPFPNNFYSQPVRRPSPRPLVAAACMHWRADRPPRRSRAL